MLTGAEAKKIRVLAGVENTQKFAELIGATRGQVDYGERADRSERPIPDDLEQKIRAQFPRECDSVERLRGESQEENEPPVVFNGEGAPPARRPVSSGNRISLRQGSSVDFEGDPLATMRPEQIDSFMASLERMGFRFEGIGPPGSSSRKKSK